LRLDIAKDSKATGTLVNNSETFGMIMNATAFHTLSSTLYKNPYAAIIRELSCNALDAHIEVGIPEKPFVLAFPVASDNTLVIRDYGPGIAPDDIFSIYTTFFESTKRDSNDSVGYFGLGSKTPFAYTDTFTVISRHKGMKRSYVMFKDEGVFKVNLVEETATDEESGLEVRIPVKPQDVKRFIDATKEELKFFPVRPETNICIDWPDFDPVFKFGNVKAIKSLNRYTDSQLVQIGPVAYPIRTSDIRQYCEFPDVLSTTSWVIEMPIGSVTVQPSREGIHLDERTAKNIAVRAKESVECLKEELISYLDEAYESGGFREVYRRVLAIPRDFVRSVVKNGPIDKYYPIRIEAGAAWGIDVLAFSDLIEDHKTKKPLVRFKKFDGTSRLKDAEFLTHLANAPVIYVKDSNYCWKSKLQKEAERQKGHLPVLTFDSSVSKNDKKKILNKLSKYLTLKNISELPNVQNEKAGSSSKRRSGNCYHVTHLFNRASDVKSVCNIRLHTRAAKVSLEKIDKDAIVVRCNSGMLQSEEDSARLALAQSMVLAREYKIVAVPANVDISGLGLREISSLSDEHIDYIKKVVEHSIDMGCASAILSICKRYIGIMYDLKLNDNSLYTKMKDFSQKVSKTIAESMKKNNFPEINTRCLCALSSMPEISDIATNYIETQNNPEMFIKFAGQRIGVDLMTPSEFMRNLLEIIDIKNIIKDYLSNMIPSSTMYLGLSLGWMNFELDFGQIVEEFFTKSKGD